MKKLLLVLLLGMICGELYGQDVRARLESERKQLQQEIVQINGMLQKNKNQTRHKTTQNDGMSFRDDGDDSELDSGDAEQLFIVFEGGCCGLMGSWTQATATITAQ